MNNFTVLIPESLQHALAHALVDSLWQAAAITALLWGLRHVLKMPHRATVLLSLAGLSLFMLWNVAGFAMALTGSGHLTSPFAGISPWALSDEAMPWINLIWFVGSLIFFIRLAFSHVYLSKFVRQAVPLAHPSWEKPLRKLEQRLGLSWKHSLMQSDRLGTAILTGVFKPLIVVPAAWVNSLSPKEVECILAHELAHLTVGDQWTNLLVQFAEVVYFFNPAVHILLGQIRLDRELSADTLAGKHTAAPLVYAKLILKVEEQRGFVPLGSIPFFRPKNQLRRRIENILYPEVKAHPRFGAIQLIVILTSVCMLMVGRGERPLEETRQVVVDGGEKGEEMVCLPVLSKQGRQPVRPHRRTPQPGRQHAAKPGTVQQKTAVPELPERREEMVAVEESPVKRETTVRPRVFTLHNDTLGGADGDGAWIISTQGKSFHVEIVRSAEGITIRGDRNGLRGNARKPEVSAPKKKTSTAILEILKMSEQ
ncbi:MAG: M56 family metallopeptidase [Saprospiraceae bacterium]|nr:M56 family metallopeptidase [Saprospiraceae bacterium]